MTALDTAIDLLRRGLWPVPITPIDDPSALAPGKQPIGSAWGVERHTEKTLRALYRRHPDAGVGLKLGPEGGVVDIEIEDRLKGQATLDLLFGGERPETLGWESTRGPHLVFAWDERFRRYGKAIIKGPDLPGVEIRIGFSDSGQQYQSVCPPSPDASGTARAWNGFSAVARAPDCLFAALDEVFAARDARKAERPAIGTDALRPRSVRLWDVERRATAYLKSCQPAVSGERGHDQTFKVACKVGPGFDLAPEAALRLVASVYNPTCDPPWSEKELRHKIEDAYEEETRRGWLLGMTVEQPGAGGGGGDEPPPEQPGAGAPDEHPDDPHRLARSFLASHAGPDGFPTLRYWLEEWHQWDGCRYRTVSASELRGLVVTHVKRELDEVAAMTGRPAARVTTGIVGNVMQALTGLALLTRRDCPEQPAWLEEVGEESPSPSEVIPADNGLIHLAAVVEGRRGLLPPTPRYFSPNCLGYRFDPEPPRPDAWLKFLDSVWPDDPDSIRCLQEWFGYLLTTDTSQQKILVLIGPTRSGKGTIARALSAVVGEQNVTSPTLSGMATNFGIAPLIGKTVAVFPDARLSGRADSQVIVERLLSISGEDCQTIDRKHLSSWSGRLLTRLVLISNELPRLGDSSGAITARTVILRMTRSFLGREDTELFKKIQAELPSILLWSIAGWARLRRRGRFVQPESGLELLEDLRELSSPIGTFLEERCDLDPELSVEVRKLYEAWKVWCTDHGRDHPGDEQGFGRAMRAAVPTLKLKRPRKEDGHRTREYVGVGLKATF